MRTSRIAIGICLLALWGCTAPVNHDIVGIRPAVATEPVGDDADDPAIWVNPEDGAKSLILGTNKTAAPNGAVVVYGMDGKKRQTIAGLDRPNNIDVEYGLTLGGKAVDIAVATERLQGQLRVFAIAADGSGITDVTSMGNTKVFTDRKGDKAAPMGIGIYKRPGDGAVFAIVAPKDGPREGYLGQYRLEDDGAGKVKATFVRYFGRFSGAGEIEAVAVDDALGYVYYSDEGDGTHKYWADAEHTDAGKELAHFNRGAFRGDREGIAIYTRADGTGYVICTDQIMGNSEYHIVKREGEPGRPHDHTHVLKIVRGGADETDGLDATSANLGGKFANGAMVAMNSGGRNFFVYRWDDVAETGAVKLGSGK
jgi:3-phytase